MTVWYNAVTIREDWPGAPLNDDVLTQVVSAAREAVIAYAPALVEGADIPETYRLAQRMQAENVYNAGATTPGGEFGEGTYARTVHPLDWQIKQILRPRKAVPRVR